MITVISIIHKNLQQIFSVCVRPFKIFRKKSFTLKKGGCAQNDFCTRGALKIIRI